SYNAAHFAGGPMRIRPLALALLVAAALSPFALGQDKPKLDRHGDPLPAGAVARLGSPGLRHDGVVNGLAATSDGKLAVSAGEDAVLRVWDLTKGKETGKLAGHV